MGAWSDLGTGAGGSPTYRPRTEEKGTTKPWQKGVWEGVFSFWQAPGHCSEGL